MPDRSGRNRPTNVTAVVKSLNNRARSVAAGLVIRCRQCKPVIQQPTLMRVSPVGPGASLDATSARQLKGRVRVTGGAGHNSTHERDDGCNPSQ